MPLPLHSTNESQPQLETLLQEAETQIRTGPSLELLRQIGHQGQEAPLPFCVRWVDLKANRYQYVSPNHESLLGISADHLLAEGPSALAQRIHPEDAPHVGGLMQQLRKRLRQQPWALRPHCRYTLRFRLQHGEQQRYIPVELHHKILKLDQEGWPRQELILNYDARYLAAEEDPGVHWRFLRPADPKNPRGPQRVAAQGTLGLSAPSNALSERELQVLRKTAEGHSAKQMGDELGCSKSAIDSLRNRMLRRLGLPNTAALVSWGLRQGLL